MRARKNPIPILLWVAAAAIGGASSGAAVAAVRRRNAAASTVLTGGPAISPGQPAPATVSTAAQRAMAAAQANAPVAQATAQANAVAAQAAAAAAAAHLAFITNTTYQLVLTTPAGSQIQSQEAILKLGDTLRLIPVMQGSPPVALSTTYTSNTAGIITEIGSTNGWDASFQAASVGRTILTVQIKSSAMVYATFEVTIVVVS
jgi:hypothetical protein